MRLLVAKLVLLSALVFGVHGIALAQGSSHTERVGEKLGVGLANVATGVVEIPRTMIITSKSKGIAYGLTAGFMTGIVHTVGRTLFGALDLVTFMIPTKALVQPEYVWNNFNKETIYTTNWQMRR